MALPSRSQVVSTRAAPSSTSTVFRGLQMSKIDFQSIASSVITYAPGSPPDGFAVPPDLDTDNIRSTADYESLMGFGTVPAGSAAVVPVGMDKYWEISVQHTFRPEAGSFPTYYQVFIYYEPPDGDFGSIDYWIWQTAREGYSVWGSRIVTIEPTVVGQTSGGDEVLQFVPGTVIYAVANGLSLHGDASDASTFAGPGCFTLEYLGELTA